MEGNAVLQFSSVQLPESLNDTAVQYSLFPALSGCPVLQLLNEELLWSDQYLVLYSPIQATE